MNEVIKGYFARKNYTINSGLSWEDMHPINYLFVPSQEDIEWLKEKIRKDEESLR